MDKWMNGWMDAFEEDFMSSSIHIRRNGLMDGWMDH